MTIFLVIPTLKQGGAERVMSELANFFSAKGHNVELVLLAKSQDFYKVDSRIVIHRLGFSHSGLVSKVVNEVRLFFAFRKLIDKQKPSVILSFGTSYNIFTIIATGFLKIPIYVSDRSNPLKKLPLPETFFRYVCYRFANGIIAQTHLAKEILSKQTGNKNIKVIANPVKLVPMHPEIAREQIVLTVGRMIEQKGQQYLIEALASIKDSGWKLVILGDGPLRDNLQKLVSDLGLQGFVEMPGTVSEVDKWLARSSIFAFPSISEGFPNALAEAMAAGIASISFDCNTGPRDLIENYKNGILVEERNIGELKKALELLIADSELRTKLGNEAVKIRETLSMRKIGGTYLDFLTEQIN